MKHVQRAARMCALGGTLAVALFVVGCGDDSDEPEKVAIEAAGSGDKVTFTAPAEAGAGAAEIEFTNSSAKETDAQLVFVDGDYTEEQVLAELGKAVEGQPVADWFQGGGGVGTTPAGETGTVEQELKAGTYYVVGEDEPTPPLATIEVSGDDGAEVDEPDAKVTATEYSFSGEGLKAGEQQLLLDNAGGTWHHFLAAKLKPDATIDQAKQFLQSEGEGGGPPPFEGDLENELGPVSSTVLEGGTSQVVNANLEAGKYAFFCFISDKTGGPPHVVKGMVSEVNVEE